jgi:ankyrin repeat protein
LEKGALITEKDQYGKTALMLAEENNNENAAQVLHESVK